MDKYIFPRKISKGILHLYTGSYRAYIHLWLFKENRFDTILGPDRFFFFFTSVDMTRDAVSVFGIVIKTSPPDETGELLGPDQGQPPPSSPLRVLWFGSLLHIIEQ